MKTANYEQTRSRRTATMRLTVSLLRRSGSGCEGRTNGEDRRVAPSSFIVIPFLSSS